MQSLAIPRSVFSFNDHFGLVSGNKWEPQNPPLLQKSAEYNNWNVCTMHRQKENWDNIHCMHVVPLNILFTSKGLSPAMEAFPPSRLNPKPAEVFNNSTQMTSFISRFGSAIEHTQHLVMQVTVNSKLCLVGFCFCCSDKTIQSSATQTRTSHQVSQKWMCSIVAVNGRQYKMHLHTETFSVYMFNKTCQGIFFWAKL